MLKSSLAIKHKHWWYEKILPTSWVLMWNHFLIGAIVILLSPPRYLTTEIRPINYLPDLLHNHVVMVTMGIDFVWLVKILVVVKEVQWLMLQRPKFEIRKFFTCPQKIINPIPMAYLTLVVRNYFFSFSHSSFSVFIINLSMLRLFLLNSPSLSLHF